MPLYTTRLNSFQPTPSCRGRHNITRWPRACGLFQPTPSCRGRHPSAIDPRLLPLFQPTPSCRGRPPTAAFVTPAMAISTHALVQRAAATRRLARSSPLFQPTPSCRGRPEFFYTGGGILYFNPRPRAEGGGGSMANTGRTVSISTHALVQRAAWRVYVIRQNGYFNPRPRAEGGVIDRNTPTKIRDFNPRPRAEGGSCPA